MSREQDRFKEIAATVDPRRPAIEVWRSLRKDVDAVEAEVEEFNRLLQAAGVPGVIGKKKPGVIT